MDMKSHGYEYEVVAKQKWMFYGELCCQIKSLLC